MHSRLSHESVHFCWHLIFSIVNRRCTTSCTIGHGENAIQITKGIHVTADVYAIHRRRDLWGEDADDFRPQR